MISKRIFVCSAFSGQEENLILARKYSKYTLDAGNAPYAPHLIYPQMLDDLDPAGRKLGLTAGLEFLKCCDEVWVYVVKGVISSGMTTEILFAIDYGVPVKYFSYDGHSITQLSHLPDNKLPTQSELLLPVPFADKAKIALDDVAKLLKGGASYEVVMAQLDFVVPMAAEEDIEAAAAWEFSYRNK